MISFRCIIFFQVVFVFAGERTADVFKVCNEAALKQDQQIVFSGLNPTRKPPSKESLQKIVCLTCKYRTKLRSENFSNAVSSVRNACGPDICEVTKQLCFRHKCKGPNSSIKSELNRIMSCLHSNWLHLGSKISET